MYVYMNKTYEVYMYDACIHPPIRNKVEEVDAAQRSIKLSGVDLVDGTPVLDVKPYVPAYDCPRKRDSNSSSSGETGGGDDVRVAVGIFIFCIF